MDLLFVLLGDTGAGAGVFGTNRLSLGMDFDRSSKEPTGVTELDDDPDSEANRVDRADGVSGVWGPELSE
jgi:hypothetical protein